MMPSAVPSSNTQSLHNIKKATRGHLMMATETTIPLSTTDADTATSHTSDDHPSPTNTTPSPSLPSIASTADSQKQQWCPFPAYEALEALGRTSPVTTPSPELLDKQGLPWGPNDIPYPDMPLLGPPPALSVFNKGRAKHVGRPGWWRTVKGLTESVCSLIDAPSECMPTHPRPTGLQKGNLVVLDLKHLGFALQAALLRIGYMPLADDLVIQRLIGTLSCGREYVGKVAITGNPRLTQRDFTSIFYDLNIIPVNEVHQVLKLLRGIARSRKGTEGEAVFTMLALPMTEKEVKSIERVALEARAAGFDVELVCLTEHVNRFVALGVWSRIRVVALEKLVWDFMSEEKNERKEREARKRSDSLATVVTCSCNDEQ
ncbi:hypothetical protein CALCODRAFT_557938 [Calocera cornea HHB12733]|uniref:Uncharacterized protein n=1 Tax=Calocera cornea HHB12733 TaxID=1353952 RepID=A0A165DFS3_9BASI|nr:hypothetical protein CALCODRAFT_557938 [Calocera cornea HHB12733]